MLKDITLGQYYRADSVIHRMDARTKIVGTVLYMVSLFIFNNCICYALAAIFLITVMALSKIPPKFMFRGMKSILFLLLFTVFYNIFLGTGTVIVKFWVFQVTYEGIVNAFYMLVRLFMLYVGSSLMTLTTTPNQLTDGLESLFKPLKVFRIPVHEMAMMMSIALRFIPILMEETDRIMKAQIARGADLESRQISKRIKSLIPILVPLFVSAFRRAGDLALAMEARCYHGGDGRTRMKEMKFAGRDVAAWFVIAGYFGAVIFCGIYFKGFTDYLVAELQTGLELIVAFVKGIG